MSESVSVDLCHTQSYAVPFDANLGLCDAPRLQPVCPGPESDDRACVGPSQQQSDDQSPLSVHIGLHHMSLTRQLLEAVSLHCSILQPPPLGALRPATRSRAGNPDRT
jgi:hypothetical protein